MGRQYQAVKERHRDKIVLFRLGDFFEMFNEDAVKASRILGIALTGRGKGAARMPMAGIPAHAAEAYVAKLVAAGEKVVVCDQAESARPGVKLVRREVTRIVTPGTLIDEESLLDAKRNNYLVAVRPGEGRVGVASVDLSTGLFRIGEFEPHEATEEIARLEPAEILLPESVVRDEKPPPYGREAARRASQSARPDWSFDEAEGRARLLEQLGARTLEGYGCEGMPLAHGAAGAALRYLEETHRDALGHLRRVEGVSSGDALGLDPAAIRHLEIVASQRTGDRSRSLLGVVDATRTAMGARRLRELLLRPLRDPGAIDERLDGVEDLVRDAPMRREARELLSGMPDLARLAAKTSAHRANPRDLLALADALERAPRLAAELGAASSAILARTREALAPPEGLAERITGSVEPDAPAEVGGGRVIRRGLNEDLDRLRQLAAGTREALAELQARESERTGIGSLKVAYNRVFGYYIEVSRPNLDRVPADYERRQTLVNAERFVTPELKKWEAEVLGAQEGIARLETELFEALRGEVAGQVEGVLRVADAVAEADVLAGLAEVAAARGYVRPEVAGDARIEIRDARHPVVETMLPAGEFVPNDLGLDRAGPQLLIITGPNMAGKSTYIRTAALLVILAQAGSFVPAASAHVGVFDRIFTRVGATDDLARGQSTFMVEMVETAYILHHATERSLVLLDEVGRGTSTFDGVSIAWAVTEHLASREGPRPRTLFATHYHELTELARVHENIANYNVAVREWGDEITFLYRIVPGGADKSYGIHVGRLAGLPRAVVERAKEVLANLEGQALDVGERPVLAHRAGEPPADETQLSLFRPRRAREEARAGRSPQAGPPPERDGAEAAVLDELRGLDLDQMRPVDALGRLAELQARLAPKEPEGKSSRKARRRVARKRKRG